jgi:hypothetical protein
MSTITPCPSPKQGTRLLSLQLEAEGFTARFDKRLKEEKCHAPGKYARYVLL